MNEQSAPGTKLRQTILPRVQGLSPTLRVAADYILKNPDTVAMHSLR